MFCLTLRFVLKSTSNNNTQVADIGLRPLILPNSSFQNNNLHNTKTREHKHSTNRKKDE